MKKILIVNKSFETGGIQSSMVNMANELSNNYQVDLFIYNPFGPMKERLNKNVRILDTSWCFKALAMPLNGVLKTKDLRMILFKVFAAVWTKIFNNSLPIKIAVKKQGAIGTYDLAIAYHQEQRKKAVVSGFARVVDKCVEAKVKAAWLHFDSNTISLDSDYNNKFYEKMDKIVCVSKSLMENFANNNPHLKDKMDYCYNFMSYEKIFSQSELKQEIKYPENKFICFSACRLAKEKALVRAINSMSSVFKNNSDLMWYIAGDGIEKINIENAIKENNLKNRIILLGNQPNPYPYIKNADLVINVSYHEAAPMVFLEAKALKVPVFATETSSAKEILNDGVDSFICENTEEGIEKGFSQLLSDKGKISEAKKHLQDYIANNDASFEKIISFIN